MPSRKIPDQQFYHALISAPSEKEIQKILKNLLQKRLIAGGMITKGKAGYWWKGKIVQKTYFNLSAFTVSHHQSTIIKEVRKGQKDETPIIVFSKIDAASRDFLAWIQKETKVLNLPRR